MSNPTLDAAWSDYAERSGLTIDGVACSPAKTQSAYFAFEAGWNRRAQTEGEAPQADDLARSDLLLALQAALETCETKSGAPKMSHLETLRALNAAIDAATRTAPAATLSPLCGAQHAESGKERGSIGDLAEFHILLNWYDNEDSYGSINDGRNKLTEYIDKWASKRAAQLDGGQEGSESNG